MKVLIVGLGLIGASYAIGLRQKGLIVYGVDRDKKTLDYAKKEGFVDEVSLEPSDFINDVDLIIIALYPKDILKFLKTYQNEFKKGQIITDVCGIKTDFVYKAIKVVKNATYLSHHPMAGREKTGIYYANPDIFKGANFLICPIDNKEEDIDVLKK